MGEIILINISGRDKIGLTAEIADILARHKVNILDIGQAVIHNHLSLGIMIDVPKQSESSPILKDVLFKTNELGLDVNFTPISLQSYNDWVKQQGKSSYIVTLISRRINSEQIAGVARILADNGLNIDDIDRLSGRIPPDNGEAAPTKACVEFLVRGEPKDPFAIRAEFMRVSNELNLDIAFQKDTAYRRNRSLVAFDMDSTLIDCEIIDELAKAAGAGEEVAAITEQAMRGEMDFTQSLKRRVALLKGLDQKVLEETAENMPLTEGAENLISTLKFLGYKTAIISGGFKYFGEHLKKRLGINYVYANDLEIENGRVTGRVIEPVVDGRRKAELLRKIAQKEGISLEQVIAVGDGANDLPMLSIAGLGIAFRAKPAVKKNAKQAISTLGLDAILYLIGVRDRDSIELARTART